MKILHIAVLGDLGSGASAYWLHKALINRGIESKIFISLKLETNDASVYSANKSNKDKLLSIVDRVFLRLFRKKKQISFSTGFTGVDFTKTEVYKEADIIHLHWIGAGFVNMKHLSKIDKPIVWTMRDMWPMTGGCHYSMGCDNFISGCGNCEQLGSNTKFDLSKIILNRKKKYLPKNMKLVGISNWVSKEAKRSELFRDFDIRTIFNHISTDNFFSIDKSVAREKLGIKTDKKIILAGATNLKMYYKGFDKFVEAIKLLNKDKYFLCFFGELDNYTANNFGFEYKNFGFIEDIKTVGLIFNAGDVFVAPSVQEAFGKTLTEAMVCETPVVCFDATGPKDIVDHKVNGYRAKPFEPSDLAKGIEWVLNNKNYDTICKKARTKVLEKFDSKVTAKQYIELYKEIFGKKDK